MISDDHLPIFTRETGRKTSDLAWGRVDVDIAGTRAHNVCVHLSIAGA